MTFKQRFWARVEKSKVCWNWTGATNKGYGRLGDGSGGYVYAHQLSYRWHFGAIPEGKQIDHLCRNPRCVNPKHLEAVTQAENMRRGFGISAVCARQTQCKYGHPFNEENTRFRYRKNGVVERQCRKCRQRCHLDRTRRRRAEAKCA